MTTIYAAYSENKFQDLEKMIGYAIGCVHLPPPRGPKLSFSLCGTDNQVVYPPLSDSIPITNQSVAVIFNQLGEYVNKSKNKMLCKDIMDKMYVLSLNKGRFCKNSEIDTLISKLLSVENKAKLSPLTRADFVTIAKLTH